MKTKYFFRICLSLFIMLILTSCNENNFMDLSNPNNNTDKDFWKTKNDALEALATCYRPLTYEMQLGYYGAFYGWLNLLSRGDDIYACLHGEDSNDMDVAAFRNSPATTTGIYDGLYNGIQRANVLLCNIDKIPTSELGDADRAMIKGEALFLRAYQYFLLVNNFKEVPLRLRPSQEEIMKEAAPEDQIWQQVESDLKQALESLPIKRTNADKGRVEKGAVVFLLGKVYATEHKYPEAKAMLSKLMPSSIGGTDAELGNRYRLMDNFADNFLPTSEFNAESIFELNYDGRGSWNDDSPTDMGTSIPQFIGPQKSGGWQKIFASAFAVQQFLSDTDQVNHAVTQTKFDKRMYASLFFDPDSCGDIMPQLKPKKWYGGNWSTEDLWKGSSKRDPAIVYPCIGHSKVGKFILKKYTGYFSNDPIADEMKNAEVCGNNIRIMRYDEAILLYAEACSKTGDPNVNGALKMIRDRAGLISKQFNTPDEQMKEIEFENCLEFFGEGHRFDDLRRWYSFDEIHKKYQQHHKQGSSDIAGDHFVPKYLYYPIPITELQNNIKMTQNSAWS